MKPNKIFLVIVAFLLGFISLGIAEQKKDLTKTASAAQSQRALIEITNTSINIVKTKVLINQKLICEIGYDDQCKTSMDTGKHEMTLDNPSYFGTFSEKYDFEAGSTYKFEIVTDWGNILFFGEIFSPKGKDGTLKLNLISVEKTIK